MKDRSPRDLMIEQQLIGRGITDPAVLKAMDEVLRERFVPEHLAEYAYEDTPLPIAKQQTISQPYIVAFMIQSLELGNQDKVLEIGTGSGYAAAVLSKIVQSVYTVELHPELAEGAVQKFTQLGIHNVVVRCADGSQGWSEYAPYDGILVSAVAPQIPKSLKEQLKVGAKMVIPVGEVDAPQDLVVVQRVDAGHYTETKLGEVKFVPLVSGTT